MKWLANIVCYFTVVVITLHNIISHDHHSQLTEQENIEQHKSADDIVDFIALAFHYDQHDGHLQEYIDVDNDFPDFNLTPFIYIFLNQDFQAEEEKPVAFNLEKDQNIVLPEWYDSDILRGPPFQS